jgi:hypothetical protein
MGAVGHEGGQLAVDEQRRDQGHVGQVRPAEKRIVHDHHVPRGPLHTPDNLPHGIGHAAQVDRDVRGLSTQLAVGVEHRAGKVQAVLDVGRQGGTLQGGAHLIAHGGDAAGEDTEFDGVHCEDDERYCTAGQ